MASWGACMAVSKNRGPQNRPDPNMFIILVTELPRIVIGLLRFGNSYMVAGDCQTVSWVLSLP